MHIMKEDTQRVSVTEEDENKIKGNTGNCQLLILTLRSVSVDISSVFNKTIYTNIFIGIIIFQRETIEQNDLTPDLIMLSGVRSTHSQCLLALVESCQNKIS